VEPDLKSQTPALGM